MKAREIREKTLEEIKDDLTAAEENFRTLHYQLVTNQLENTSAVKIAKRNIAKLKTILREHELGVHPLHSINKTASGEV
jgi:large subunit ribosomal protein L29